MFLCIPDMSWDNMNPFAMDGSGMQAWFVQSSLQWGLIIGPGQGAWPVHFLVGFYPISTAWPFGWGWGGCPVGLEVTGNMSGKGKVWRLCPHWHSCVIHGRKAYRASLKIPHLIIMPVIILSYFNIHMDNCLKYRIFNSLTFYVSRILYYHFSIHSMGHTQSCWYHQRTFQ